MECPGILDLSKTYGSEKNKKLYMCRPNDIARPPCLIPYHKPVTFDKSAHYIYVLFEYKTDNKKTGVLRSVLGRVEHLDSTYNYLLYCKSLNHSIQPFTKEVDTQLKKHVSVIEDIAKHYGLVERTGHIFTLDSCHTIDYDDALSVCQNVVSIYITNVPIVLDYLGLSVSKRVSSIYLPDKKISMLPSGLNALCSLNERTHRICLVMDITYVDGVATLPRVSVCKAMISRNYSYESDKIHPDIERVCALCKVSRSDLIAKIMVDFNAHATTLLKSYEVGIYKEILPYKSPQTIVEHIETFKHRAMPYVSYVANVHYGTFTSPIRRLVDLYNMYDLCKAAKLCAFIRDEPTRLSLDQLNRDTTSVRQIQHKCKLLSLFERGETYEGYVYDTVDPKVFFPSLNLIYPFSTTSTYPEYSRHRFRLVMLCDEVHLKRKLRLVIHTETDCS